MPQTKQDALSFLETQWSSINDNKIKGIKAEAEFRQYLEDNEIHYIPGGWILTPGKNTNVKIPSEHKICLLPMEKGFSWSKKNAHLFISPALISAYNYFRQVGVKTFFVEPTNVDETAFSVPKKSTGTKRAVYPRPYDLRFNTISPSGGLAKVDYAEVFSSFPPRDGNRGLRCYSQNRISIHSAPWNDSELLKGLFWFEYTRYFCQVDFLISNNDLDLFIIGKSGGAYPIELKSKSPVIDNSSGDWFGLDIGPFAKMAFFTANSMNTDALYIVQEVDEQRTLVQWLGIRFTQLVKSCSWVGQAGGQGMSGGASSTIKVPKAAFTELSILLREL
ncbi:hypothetical protein [Alteromonas confluentis]|uniref:Uncharacterized protein n=1 Tax=Alteromonas confluentis TaxID=1656094 RepID=A0A1E7ZD38_9ALTE|nr:hypothetical protein [Alteromonas confluentis]OFC71381.1 hypothetical protein BFC18_09545 [Alteromonas confluentis]